LRKHQRNGLGKAVPFSFDPAAEWRKKGAHGDSRGINAAKSTSPGRGDRKKMLEDSFAPAGASGVLPDNPQLSPWAIL